MTEFIKLTIQNWQSAWGNKAFRTTLLLEVVLLFTLLISTSFFFTYIQDLKQGTVLNDWVLKRLPAIDVSIPIVCLMSSVVLLYIVRCATDPNRVIMYVMAVIFQLIFRIITINCTRFLAPPELIALQDPIGNILYQSRFITKDLFYSGHTSAMFLFFLCATKKGDKIYMLLTTIMVAFLLLVQHVHYTVDVVFAPIFAFSGYWLAKRILSFQNAFVTNQELV